MNQSSFSQILRLLKRTGGKYVIVENGKPVFVIQTWEDYQRQSYKVKETSELSEEEIIDKINREIALWKEGQDKKRILDEFGNAPDIPPEEDFGYLEDKNLSTDVDIEEIPF